ncbi:hypothetical protein AMAG_06605 [Allomyces macrogynus ATCC 38327]|uniref:Uncharacterized protein n=1 Tax=Allomyces macrogynus (strain ATCC 38327) TaxID=578462 RepID=A0A0L0SE68_ALLM3|nr:hypothetical protein AMAG_06605 [Allomyces macrogynus ATCC 38327]|eukprot:KNE60838.1 hypothetical protein AMAG_06605 [Allomyces macrogynus ATCC 38327]
MAGNPRPTRPTRSRRSPNKRFSKISSRISARRGSSRRSCAVPRRIRWRRSRRPRRARAATRRGRRAGRGRRTSCTTRPRNSRRVPRRARRARIWAVPAGRRRRAGRGVT